MAGSRESGLKTVARLKDKYGLTPDGKSAFHTAIGRRGGKSPKKTPSGFKTMDKEKIREAGRKGGTASSRKGVRHGEGKRPEPTAYELYTDVRTI